MKTTNVEHKMRLAAVLTYLHTYGQDSGMRHRVMTALTKLSAQDLHDLITLRDLRAQEIVRETRVGSAGCDECGNVFPFDVVVNTADGANLDLCPQCMERYKEEVAEACEHERRMHETHPHLF